MNRKRRIDRFFENPTALNGASLEKPGHRKPQKDINSIDRAAAAEVLRINSKFSLELYAKVLHFIKPIADRVVEDLRKAGLK